VRVLGAELRGAASSRLEAVRRQIGYIFQAHNLLDALTASQNVQMALLLDPDTSRAESRQRAEAMLDAVGIGERAQQYPSQLSGGQRQRVAIARALAGRPRLILADEPTASLDKQSGREVVDLMHDLAKKQGVTAESLKEARAKGIPGARFGDAAEFGDACAYLCSAQAGYVVGQNFLIDGGAYPGTF
jgi:putative ABC transport system ATP-binding protein